MPEREREAMLARLVGERLRLARLRRHKQQTVVAGLAGIAVDYLSQIERGLKLPSLMVLTELARVLDVPLSMLFGEVSSDSRSERAAMPARSDVKKPNPTFVFDAIPAQGDAPIADRICAAMTSRRREATTPGDQLASIRAGICNAWHVWQHSPQRYSQLGSLAPSLVTDVEQKLYTLRGEEVCSERRVAARHASDLYGLLRSFCIVSGWAAWSCHY